MKEHLKVLHENIRRIRKDKGLSQDQVAKKIGVNQSLYSRWESDSQSMNLDSLSRICSALEIEMIELFRPSDPRQLSDQDKWELLQQIEPSDREAIMRMIDLAIIAHQRKHGQIKDRKDELTRLTTPSKTQDRSID